MTLGGGGGGGFVFRIRRVFLHDVWSVGPSVGFVYRLES